MPTQTGSETQNRYQPCARLTKVCAIAGGQTAVASAIGVARGQLNRWCTGATAIKADKLAMIAVAVKCDPGWLLTGQGEAFPGSSSLNDPESREGLVRLAESVLETLSRVLPLLSREEREAVLAAGQGPTANGRTIHVSYKGSMDQSDR